MQAKPDLTTSREQPSMVRDKIQAALQRWRVTLSFAFAVLAILLAEPTIRLILGGGILSFLGAALRAWATGYLKKDQELSTGGPYAYTRNPLYLGSFFIGLGVIIGCGSWFLLAVFLVLFFLLYSSAMMREAAHLHRLFPQEYPPYAMAVPVFFPRLSPYRASSGHFSVARYKHHREYQVLIILLLVWGLLLAKAAWVQARPVRVEAQSEQATEAVRHEAHRPFAVGETLTYEAHYSKLFVSGKIGRLTLTVTRSTEQPLVGSYHFKAEAVSEGFWPSVLGIQVKDVFESFVGPADFSVQRTRKHLSHNKKQEFELAVFDRYQSSVMVIKRDLSRRDSKPEVKQEPTRPWVQDVISALYYLRTLPMEVGRTIEFQLSDSGRTFNFEVNVLSQEQTQTSAGEFNTVKLQPLIFGEDKVIRKDGEMYLWLSDDARHIPVRAWVGGSFGTATIELTSMSGVDNAAPF